MQDQTEVLAAQVDVWSIWGTGWRLHSGVAGRQVHYYDSRHGRHFSPHDKRRRGWGQAMALWETVGHHLKYLGGEEGGEETNQKELRLQKHQSRRAAWTQVEQETLTDPSR